MKVREFLETFISHNTVEVASRTTGATLEEDIRLGTDSKYLDSEIALWGIHNEYSNPEKKGNIVVYVEKIRRNR